MKAELLWRGLGPVTGLEGGCPFSPALLLCEDTGFKVASWEQSEPHQLLNLLEP